jgi:KDO2-lipid IV(A) lauroyltransferase
VAFLAHLGNWEVLMPFIASFGARPMVLYRAPRNRRVLEDLRRWRGDFCELIESRPGAAARVAAGMKEGGHLCMLMDQRLPGSPAVPFFGRPAETNPIVGRLARQFDCPVVGTRCIRLPGSRFRVEVTAPLDLPRDDDGKVDADRTTAAVNAVIEGWVREHPDQWLWLHNRWGD